ncbi:phosphatases II [Parathielavia hyrcaniae]|uniref:phosphatidylinositol-3,4,5-trisphosphate 3-phosphatase n=1 Tax=Parathielavia hyrcaniae TaxID=113614 RepID=A0AAN6SWU6_9PEZI|nr:phosphatases II [Parathielavia hyrcaniae]
MASILRQIVAGPRAKHEETGLDLCYVTSNLIATSGPSQTYPQRAYRNPLDRLVSFLDARHGDGWAIWEFRAEGTGYPDEAVYGRIRHYPWPDHHPPPFGLVPGIVGGMRRWLDGGPLETSAGSSAGGGGGGCCSDGVGDGAQGGGGGAAAAVGKKEDAGGMAGRVVVVHCKAGKGRSGSMACSYLIAECGWTAEDALARFTERRMRPGFGAGVSIPSQLRWVSYVDRWTKGGKRYVDRPVEIVEVHVWGLRHGVKVAVEGFAEEGKKIRVLHTFKGGERVVVEAGAPGGAGVVDFVQDLAGYGVKTAVDDKGEVVEEADYEGITKGVGADSNGSGDSNGDSKLDVPSRSSSKSRKTSRTTGLMRKLSRRRSRSAHGTDKGADNGPRSKTIALPDETQTHSSGGSLPGKDEPRSQSTTSLQTAISFADPTEPGGQAVIFKPTSSIQIPNSDVNISVERRNRAHAGMGLTMVTAVAHVWFNVFFEGNGPEQDGKADDSGVFEIEWDKMDGIKGSSQRGTRALDRLSVIWRVAGSGAADTEGTAASGVVINEPGVVINEPGEHSPVPQVQPADWKGGNEEDPTADKRLGLRVEDPESQGVSKASSVKSQDIGEGGRADKQADNADDQASLEGVKVSGPAGEEVLDETPGRGSSPLPGHK